MASPLQRRPVTVYSPNRTSVRPPEARVGPGRVQRGGGARVAPPLTGRVGEMRERTSPWSGFAQRVTSTPAAQAAANQEAQEAAEQAAYDEQSNLMKGLGWVIGNPLVQNAIAPFGAFGTGSRAAVLGVEEAGEALAGAPDWLQGIAASNQMTRGLLSVDTDRTEADTRSNWAKVLKPDSTYGFGEIAPSTGNKLADRLVGFTGDVALDPLSYVGGGTKKLVEAGARGVKAAEATQLGTRLDEIARAMDDAAQAKDFNTFSRLSSEAQDLEDQWRAINTAREAMPMLEVSAQANRGGRIAEAARLHNQPEVVKRLAPDISRMTQRGIGTASPALREALGLQPAGLRVLGAPIAGTEKISRAINEGIGLARVAVNQKIPGLRNLGRGAKGLEGAYDTLIRGGTLVDVQGALSDAAFSNLDRVGGGIIRGTGKAAARELARGELRGVSAAERQALVSAAETTSDPNVVNQFFAKIAGIYKGVTGKDITLYSDLDPNKYVPHILTNKFRRMLQANKDTPLVQKFTKRADFNMEDLLEGSNHVERSRRMRPNSNGTPRTVNFDEYGEITITEGSIDELNDLLRQIFPTFDGKFYEDDFYKIAESYVDSLARGGGAEYGRRAMARSGDPNFRVVEGDLARVVEAHQAALKAQNPLADQVLAGYEPGKRLPDIAEPARIPGQVPEGEVATADDLLAQEYLGTKVQKGATTRRTSEVMDKGRRYVGDLMGDVNLTRARVADFLSDFRKNVAEGLRLAGKDADRRLKELDKLVVDYHVRLQELGPLTEKTRLHWLDVWLGLNKNVSDLENEIGKVNRAIEPEMVAEVEHRTRQRLSKLKALRREAKEKIRTGPARLSEEIFKRTEELYTPVRQAQQVLEEAKAAVPRSYVDEAGVTHAYTVKDVDWARQRQAPASQKTPERIRQDRAFAEASVARENDYNARLRALDPKSAEYRELQAEKDAWLVEQRKVGRFLFEEGYGRQPLRGGQLTKAQQAQRAKAAAIMKAEADREELIRRSTGEARLESPQPVDVPLTIDELHWGSKVNDVTGREGTVRPVTDPEQVVVDFGEGSAVSYSRSEIGQHLTRSTTPEPTDFDDAVRQANLKLQQAQRRMVQWQEANIYVKTVDPATGEAIPSQQALPSTQAAASIQPEQPFVRLMSPPKNIDADKWADTRRVLANSVGDERMLRYDNGQTLLAVRENWDQLDDVGRQRLASLGWGWSKPRPAAAPAVAPPPKPMTTRVQVPGDPAAGRAAGERRIVEQVTDPPQPQAYRDMPRPISVDPRTGKAIYETMDPPFPRPVTEQEAIENVRRLQQQQVEPLQREIRSAEANIKQSEGTLRRVEEGEVLPQDEVPAIAALREALTAPERKAADFFRGVRSDVEVTGQEEVAGLVKETVETQAKLAADVTERASLQQRRRSLAASEAQVKASASPKQRPGHTRPDLVQTINDLKAVIQDNPLMDDVTKNATESLLHSHVDDAMRVAEGDIRIDQVNKMLRSPKKVAEVAVTVTGKNWDMMHKGALQRGDVIVQHELHHRFEMLNRTINDEQWLGRTFNALTNMFKTYATLSPGFHVRNAMSAMFMNASDGVVLKNQYDGARLWRQYMGKNRFSQKGQDLGATWLNQQPEEIQKAFAAVFGSGAGGRFTEAGVAEATGKFKIYDWLISNKLTRASQRWGERVEGGVRLGMALDSIRNGDTVTGALERVTRVHFDYSQVSRLDESAKRFIPFWTFMSRNLPLQMTQMWTKPKAYMMFDHFRDNFAAEDEQLTPDYWKEAGAFNTGLKNAGGLPVYLQPDLGFTRLPADAADLQKALSGQNRGALMANLNPWLTAPLEYATEQDFYTGRKYGATDYSTVGGIPGAIINPLAVITGDRNEAGQVSDKFQNSIRAVLPMLDRQMRLFPGASGGSGGTGDSQRTLEAWLRFGGAPVRFLTPAQQRSEAYRRYYDQRDEAARLRAMVRSMAEEASA